jgi:hypothetical protein
VSYGQKFVARRRRSQSIAAIAGSMSNAKAASETGPAG